MASRILARIARQGGARLLDMAVDRVFPAPIRPESAPEPASAPAPEAKARPGSLGGKLAGAALLKIATRSVPGAILIGGGYLAKTLYDRRHAHNIAKDSPDAGA